VLGVDIRAWFGTLYPPFVLVEEQIAAMEGTRNGMVVGAITAAKQGWRLGDRIPLQSSLAQKNGATVWDFEIVGIYHIPNRPNWATSVLANYDYINDARAEGNNMSLQYIARVADPERYAQVATAVDELFANSASQTVTRSEEDFVRVLLAQIGNINYLLNGVVAAVLFVLLFLTSNTMMLAVRERIPEFAVLKTLGFTGPSLLAMVLGEILLVCALASVLGLGGATLVFPQLVAAMPTESQLDGMRILPAVHGWGIAIAALMALVSGLPPALRAMRLNIIDGLANR
jgi:putative ABC transport system permease protein